MVCQGECYTKNYAKDFLDKQNQWDAMSVQIEFMNFSGRVGWRLNKNAKTVVRPKHLTDD